MQTGLKHWLNIQGTRHDKLFIDKQCKRKVANIVIGDSMQMVPKSDFQAKQLSAWPGLGWVTALLSLLTVIAL